MTNACARKNRSSACVCVNTVRYEDNCDVSLDPACSYTGADLLDLRVVCIEYPMSVSIFYSAVVVSFLSFVVDVHSFAQFGSLFLEYTNGYSRRRASAAAAARLFLLLLLLLLDVWLTS